MLEEKRGSHQTQGVTVRVRWNTLEGQAVGHGEKMRKKTEKKKEWQGKNGCGRPQGRVTPLVGPRKCTKRGDLRKVQKEKPEGVWEVD